MAKLKLKFDGFEEVTARLKKLEGNVTTVTEKALKASQDFVNPNLHSAMKPHHRTGKTEGAIVENSPVKWTGTLAKIDVGFDIEHGGLPSVYLMFGTKAHKVIFHGTPRRHPGTEADKRLYNAIYGNSTQTKIKEIQADIFYDEIRKLGG